MNWPILLILSIILVSCGDSRILVHGIGNIETVSDLSDFQAKSDVLKSGSVLTQNHPYSKWKYTQKLSFDPSFLSAKIEHVQVMVKLTSARFDYTKTHNDGRDLRFSDADGNPLAYEIADWNYNGDSIIWVNLPKMDPAGVKNYFYMYFDDSLVVTDSGDAKSVWPGYSKVLHLNGDVKNALSSEVALDHNTSDQTEGILGNARLFDASQSSFLLLGDSKVSSRKGSVCMWIKTVIDMASHQILFYSSGTQSGFGTNDFHLNLNASEGAQLWGEGDSSVEGVIPLNDNTWHLICGSWEQSSNSVSLFVDGALASSDVYNLNSYQFNSVRIGAPFLNSNQFSGGIDEFTLSGSSLSENQVKVIYKNGKDELLTFGPEVENLDIKTQYAIDVNFTKPLTQDVEFNVNVTGGVLGEDYTLASDKLNVFKGQDNVKLIINILNKDSANASKTLNIKLEHEVIDTTEFDYNIQINHNRAPEIVAKSEIYLNQGDPSIELDPITLGDADPEGGDLVIEYAIASKTGSISIANNKIQYTPDPNFFGVEKIQYRVADSNGLVGLGEFVINVMTSTTWTGAVSSDFSNSGNWCGNVVAGSCVGGVIPNTGSIVVFDDTCINCDVSLSANIDVKGFYFSENYTGTFDTNDFDINIRASGLIQYNGHFLGKSGTITMTTYGFVPSYILGGSFTAPSNFFFRYSIFMSNSVNFDHSNATMTPSADCGCSFASGLFFIQDHHVYNLDVMHTSAGYVHSFVPIYVDNNYYFNGQGITNLYIGAEVYVAGDVTFENYNSSGQGSFRMNLFGNKHQQLNQIGGTMPNLRLYIDKQENTVSLGTNVALDGPAMEVDFVLTQGTVDLNGFNLSLANDVGLLGVGTSIVRNGGTFTDVSGVVPDGPYSNGSVLSN